MSEMREPYAPVHHGNIYKDGRDLREGDTIETWWRPGRDTITRLRPYRGPYEQGICKDARIASFAILTTGMTIFPGERYMMLGGRR